MKKIREFLRDYYRNDLKALYKFLIPLTAKSLLLSNNHLQRKLKGKYDYLVLDDILGDVEDIQTLLTGLNKLCKPNSKLILTYYNHSWEPILNLASNFGFRRKIKEQNWIDNQDLKNFLNLSGFEIITTQRRLLIPLYIPIVSDFFNIIIAKLPIINSFCLTTYTIAQPKPGIKNDCSVSIIVPTRNEAGNIAKIIPSIPKFGTEQEIIFIEGHSQDNTWDELQKEIQKKHRQNITVKIAKQKGKGKADAVHLGFKMATGDMLMIYDADRTVSAKDLEKFYDALVTGAGEFANGSRLVYPMEKEAMRSLNKIGNKVFGMLFTWILGQRFKDTLCGTKVLFKSDYQKILKVNKVFGNFDPFGDFELIFGAIKLNLKVVEIPVRYKDRVYGQTNISRFIHGFMLFQMTLKAFKIFRAW